ncbi:MlaD family protein [Mycobacteroides immunogenum]|nr:MlaD family protein [Mycobacteroides immunogenum]MCV7307088.1 MCE family protein [Mycobacteroides immunogenum]
MALSSCSVNPARIRMPDTSTDNFSATVQFTNALNLPTGAKVTFEGVDVGTVRDIGLGTGVANVRISLKSDAQIPGNANAAIIQETVLGDPYIRLTRPSGTTDTPALLTNGAVITAEHTVPATSVEDMLTTVSSFIGGGSIQQVQGSMERIKENLPKSVEESRRAASILTSNLKGVAANGDQIDRSLDSLSKVGEITRNHEADIQTVLTEEGVTYWERIDKSADLIIRIIPGMGDIVKNGYWLIPVMDSASNALEQFGASGVDPVQFGWQLNGFTNQALLPFMADPRVDITGVTKPDGTTAETQYARKALGVGP